MGSTFPGDGLDIREKLFAACFYLTAEHIYFIIVTTSLAFQCGLKVRNSLGGWRDRSAVKSTVWPGIGGTRL
ncbi:hypothetical protein I79_003889 [Cricetulus griseus]|uniref:Uncharacterized protein n=1 Tax=Cricetulus griseus TaxID=10029 RepID=G3H165_CRIGR|nr:hypothetical protein I79_003889 [Cricetulus griseus]